MKDLLFECNTQGMTEKDFTEMFCKVCKNRKCDRATWAFSTWDERIITQVDRFFHTPSIKQSEASQYQGISDFEEYHINHKIDIWTPASVEYGKPKEEPAPKVVVIQDEINTPVQQNYFVGQPIMIEKQIEPQPSPKDEWALPPKTLKVGGKFQMGK